MTLRFLNQKNNYIFQLISSNINYDPNNKNYGIEMSQLERVGDKKPLTLPTKILKQKYSYLSEQENSLVTNFLKSQPNSERLPLKMKEQVVFYGPIADRYEVLADDVAREFEKMVETKQQSVEIGTLLESSVSFSQLVITDQIKESVKVGIAKIQMSDFLNKTWNLESVDSSQKSILNFYGKPGTGKTLCAKAVASQLGKRLLHVDYSQVESKWVGETGKNIKKIFKIAKENEAVILLDEADSLVSRRMSDGKQSQHINQERNIFMQELDSFKGVVILTTNLFENYDEAMLRRISQHIEFELPNFEQKITLYKNHIPEAVAKEELNFEELVAASIDFSGGDIKNVCMEAMVSAVMEANENNALDQAKLKQSHLLAEINKIKKSKGVYSHQRKPIALA